MHRNALTALLLLLILSSAALADTTWVNQPTVSGNWTADHSPYMIQNDVLVPMNTLLSIGPGVTVFFTGPYGLTVDGLASFQAIGNAADTIRFTSDGHNQHFWKGIVVLSSPDTVRLSYCLLEYAQEHDTMPGHYGGHALHLRFSNTLIRHSVFRHCGAGSDGGAIFQWNGTVDARSSVFSDNYGGNGGAIASWIGEFNAVDCLIEDNHAPYGGGGVYACGPDTVRLTNCTISHNYTTSAQSTGGGGICSEGSPLVLTGCTLSGNSSWRGGAIGGYPEDGIARMTYCVLTDNHADSLGGAVFSLDLLGLMEHCVFDRNSARSGGAIYAGHGYLKNCTLVRNSATLHGSAVFDVTSGNLICYNNIVSFNGPADAHANPTSAGVCLHHSDYFGNAGHNFFRQYNNLYADSGSYEFMLYRDPMFVDTAAGDFHLTAASPCIDAGWFVSPHDPDGTITDMGAYYFDQSAQAVDRSFIVHPSSFIVSSYPNPFNAVTVIRFDLPQSGEGALKIFDITGREVATLASGMLSAGSHTISYNAEALPSGTYFAVLRTSEHSIVHKLLLLK